MLLPLRHWFLFFSVSSIIHMKTSLSTGPLDARRLNSWYFHKRVVLLEETVFNVFLEN
ncbi:hypothetical protein KP509_09G040300 [Ceratopteris richardii]|uniref:Secreted protein n=1 Tax=Ceratopteris richardii TaxID=49495 RepID=A0A8T2TZQ1_CERRI|nr:hypothetical protein KP509_09G040300 [Ceratopteris richardii]